jgi:hypothetical protein
MDSALQLRGTGLTYDQISAELNIPSTTVWRMINVYSKPDYQEPTLQQRIFTQPNVSLTPKGLWNREKKEEDVMEFLERMQPVSFNFKPRIKKPQTKGNLETTLIIGDTHFGHECPSTLNIFLKTVEELRPQKIILNGDTLDMSYISRYPKDYRNVVPLHEERKRFHDFLYELHSLTEKDQTEIIETNANHSGDNASGRWWRYLNDRLGEILSLDIVQEKLSYESIFHPHGDGVRIKLQEHVELVPERLIVLHGDVVRKRGGFSASALLEKWYISTICNHTHRVGMSPRTLPSIGNRETEILRSYENGCACTLNPEYATAADWQNAFSIVQSDGYNYSVETVIVEDGIACCSTLGKTIVA